MTFKIIIRTGSLEGIEEVMSSLDAKFVRLPFKTEADIIAAAADADAVVVGATEPYTEKVISELKKVKVMSRAGIGVNNIDIAAATKYGIPVAFVPDASVGEVSDHAIALLLALARRIVPLDRAAKAGFWQTGRTEIAQIRKPMFRLENRTVGLVGIGRIGGSVAKKAQCFGMRVIAFDPYISADMAKQLNVKIVDLDTVLKESDFISLHAPASEKTYHIINADKLKLMKPGAFIINTSRGELIDEKALYTALTAGKIAGAGLDVTDPEPSKPDNPLLKLENVIITDHSAFHSIESSQDLLTRSGEAIVDALNGRWPRTIANPEVKKAANRRIK